MGLSAEPTFRVEADGQDVTETFQDRLLSLTTDDNSGEQADELEIRLDDRGNMIEEPRRGAVLTVHLGYMGKALYPVGRFTVDECWPEGPPDILMIKGKSADMKKGLKASQTRAWRETTLGDIVAKIASDNEMEAAVADDLASIEIEHRDQTDESDLHFLTRLGKDYGAVAAPKGGKLVFAPAGTGQSASGKALEPVTLDRKDLIRWRGITADRDSYGTVRARYRDIGAARTAFATAGGGDPVRTLRSTYPTQAAADAAAKAELARIGRAQGGVELEMEGRPEIAAQTPIILTGLRPSLSKRWVATTVQHRLDWESGGFITTVTANLTGKSETP